MEIFHLPLDTKHLRRQIKWLCVVMKQPFKTYYATVKKLLCDPDLGKVWTRRRIIHRLLEKYGINDQRTSEWHLKRGEMVTASEVTKAFKTATPSARREIILKKIEGAKSSDGGTNTACAWGTQFEPVAKYLYCKMNGGGQVVDTSCVVHPKYPFLGASPDGIYFAENRADPRWGKLIEFKCPISRKFDEHTPIPDTYYHQMQMQMECTNLDECDYVEMKFATCQQIEWNASTAHKGRMAFYDSGFIDYDWGDDPAWKTKLRDRPEEFRVVHWILDSWRSVNVKRDYTWLPSHIEELTQFWDEVLSHRANCTTPEIQKECVLQIDSLGDPSETPLAVSESRVEERGSSSARKKNAKTLRFDLG
jgi:putative phage-type endonuclease